MFLNVSFTHHLSSKMKHLYSCNVRVKVHSLKIQSMILRDCDDIQNSYLATFLKTHNSTISSQRNRGLNVQSYKTVYKIDF